jgi:hypothetical protein
MAPSSQGQEPPENPAHFSQRSGITVVEPTPRQRQGLLGHMRALVVSATVIRLNSFSVQGLPPGPRVILSRDRHSSEQHKTDKQSPSDTTFW